MIETIAVIGAGTMGRGIAYASALGGYRTILEDVSEQMLEKGLAYIRGAFDEGVTRGKVTPEAREKALSQISTATRVEDACRTADLVNHGNSQCYTIPQANTRY